jgi:hypothetical protein
VLLTNQKAINPQPVLKTGQSTPIMLYSNNQLPKDGTRYSYGDASNNHAEQAKAEPSQST